MLPISADDLLTPIKPKSPLRMAEPAAPQPLSSSAHPSGDLIAHSVATIRRLTQELEQERQMRLTIARELDDTQRQLAQEKLHSSHLSASVELDPHLVTEIERYRQNESVYEQQMAQSNFLSEQLRSERLLLQQRLEAATLQINQQRAENDSLQATFASLRTSHSEEIEQLRSVHESATASFEQRLSEVRQQMQSADNEARAAREQMERERHQLELEHRTALHSLEMKLRDVQHELEMCEERSQALRKQFDDERSGLSARLQHAESEHRLAESLLNKIQLERAEQQRQWISQNDARFIAAQQQWSEERERLLGEFSSERHSLEARIGEIQRALNQSLEELRRSADERVDESSKMLTRLDDAQRHKEQLEQSNTELQLKLSQVQSALEETTQRYQTSSDERDSLRHRLELAQVELSHSSASTESQLRAFVIFWFDIIEPILIIFVVLTQLASRVFRAPQATARVRGQGARAAIASQRGGLSSRFGAANFMDVAIGTSPRTVYGAIGGA